MGKRRESRSRRDLETAQVTLSTPAGLRAAKGAKISGVRGKGRTSRHVYLSADARAALADYLEHERPRDIGDGQASALFLSAASIGSRRADGRLSPRVVNLICEQIGRWHDAEHPDPTRHLFPLRPHDLRHSFAYRLSATTGHNPYELQRRLGHQSQRYIARYTNPPEHIAASRLPQHANQAGHLAVCPSSVVLRRLDRLGPVPRPVTTVSDRGLTGEFGRCVWVLPCAPPRP